MKPAIAEKLLAQPDVDGGLIGGSSFESRNVCTYLYSVMYFFSADVVILQKKHSLTKVNNIVIILGTIVYRAVFDRIFI
jgi:hypothetical protein